MVIQRFVNELMTSNCYLIYDKKLSNCCIIIDPGSRDSLQEIKFCEVNDLCPQSIILTHEHTDHNWGVNSLREHFPDVQLVCSDVCEKYIASANRAYFLFYYDDPDYAYNIAPADILVHGSMDTLSWNHKDVKFVMTPGHSYGSICIEIDTNLFTGDTIIPYPPYFNGRDSNRNDWEKSIDLICSLYDMNICIQPGHGEGLSLGEWIKMYK